MSETDARPRPPRDLRFTWRGLWFNWPADAHGGFDGVCPLCGRFFRMSKDVHAVTFNRIDGQGYPAPSVTPSVVCPYKPCTWHVVITDGVATG